MSLGILVVAAGVLLLVLPAVSDLFTSKASPTFAGFAPETGDETAENSGTVSMWVDMGASMSGFLPDRDKKCVPSSYRMVLGDLKNIAKTISPIEEVRYYRFDSGFSCVGTDVTDAKRMAVRAAQATVANTVINPILYPSDGPDGGGTSVALPSVLNVLDLNVPSIIFTDLEADGLIRSAEDYEEPLERIFSAGRCISILAMKSAFGGVLYNYANDGVDYLYGMQGAKGELPNLFDSYTNYNRPRPFYAIIVGTSEQCRVLRDAVKDSYDTQCETNITARADDIPNHGEPIAPFVQAYTADYWLSDTYRLLTTVDGEAVAVTDAEGFSQDDGSPWQASGVPEFTVAKTDTGETQTATLTLRIRPDTAGYADTYRSDTFNAQVSKIKRVIQTQSRDASLNAGETVLEGRGDRRTTLSLGSFTDEHQWFSCRVGEAAEDGVPVTLSILSSACDAGLYRVTLLVTCLHDVNIEAPLTDWADEWSLADNELLETLKKDPGKAASSTVDLAELLETFHISQANQCGSDTWNVAEITIDIIIE